MRTSNTNTGKSKALSLYRGLRKGTRRSVRCPTRDAVAVMIEELTSRLRMFPKDYDRRVLEWSDLIEPYSVPRMRERVLTFPRENRVNPIFSTSENIH